jgi:hypothetical protein
MPVQVVPRNWQIPAAYQRIDGSRTTQMGIDGSRVMRRWRGCTKYTRGSPGVAARVSSSPSVEKWWRRARGANARSGRNVHRGYRGTSFRGSGRIAGANAKRVQTPGTTAMPHAASFGRYHLRQPSRDNAC